MSRYEMKIEPTGIQGRQRVEEWCDDPGWETVKSYIEKLDGRLCTEMSLDGPTGRGMTVGGGPDRFAVTTIGDDFGPCDLYGPDLSDEPARIILGGVATDLPRRFHATREQALQAAEYFYHHGDADPSLNWHL